MGSIPFGYLLTKIFLKKDIRDIGSGNIGATNALRTGNKILAILVLLLDSLKGYLVIKIFTFSNFAMNFSKFKFSSFYLECSYLIRSPDLRLVAALARDRFLRLRASS